MGTKMVYPVWPATLTDASWQRKKGSIAKIAGKTGVGDAMKAAKALFDRLDFNSVEASQIPPGQREVDYINQRKQEVATWHNKSVEPVRKKIREIEEAANETAASWKKNKLIPKESVKAAEQVATEADHLYIALKLNSQPITDILDGYDKMIETCERTEESQRQMMGMAILNLKKALKEVIVTKTKASWTDGNTSAHQRCRSMCNVIKAIPGLKKQFFAEWSPYGDFYAKNVVAGSPDEEKDIIELVKNVNASLKKFESSFRNHL